MTLGCRLEKTIYTIRFMKVLYYYYYIFYTRVIPDNEPHATVIFTLSFSEGWLINGLLDILMAHSFCKAIPAWFMIMIFFILILVNYLIFSRTKLSKAIVLEKPKFFNNHRLSIFIAGLFALVSVSFMFWGSGYVRSVLEKC
jgi:hypothetical protein